MYLGIQGFSLSSDAGKLTEERSSPSLPPALSRMPADLLVLQHWEPMTWEAQPVSVALDI